MLIVRLKKNVKSKVPMDPKGDGGPWEDIKHLIHYVVIIDATCAQAAKGKEDIKPRNDMMQQRDM